MRSTICIFFLLLCVTLGYAQSNVSTPYCQGNYSSGQCNQSGPSNSPSNSINDFIDDFVTTGANINIVNASSGCNGLNNNYIFYGCQHYMAASPGQTITCILKSGIIFAQGFVIYVDWNQDNVFQNPGEQVAATGTMIPAAASTVTLSFVIPANANGTYRMRVRCSFSMAGFAIAPCSQEVFGETEDYNIYVGTIPPGIITATASTPNGTVCAGQQVSLNVAYSGTIVPTFTWSGPGAYSSNLQNPVITTTGQAQSGIYTVTVSNNACPVTATVPIRVVDYPSYTITPSTPTICQNGVFFAAAVFPLGVNTNSFNFNWTPTTGQGQIFSPLAHATSITPLPLPVTQSVGTAVYSLNVVPKALSCPVQKTLTVTIRNPFTPTLTMPPPLCNTFAQHQLTASPGGGTWSANSGVSTGGLLTPSLAAIGTNTVVYSVTVGSCQVSNSATFSISQFHTPALTSSLSTLCEQDPLVNLMNLVQDTVTGKWSGPSVVQSKYFSPTNLASGTYTLKYNTWSTPIDSICPSFTLFAVSVFNPPTPTITSIAPRCNTSPTLQLTAIPGGGTWNGNGISVGGLLTPSLSSIGTNTVFYTAGQGTCLASSSRTFHVSNFNTAALTGTIGHQCVTNNPVNLMSIVQNSTGVWTGMNVNNNFFNVQGLATNTYVLTYSTVSNPVPQLCPDSRTIAVHVLNPPTPDITQVGPFCNRDGTVQLSASPASGKWTPSQYLTSGGVFTPSLAPVGNNVVQYVVGTNTCFNQQSKFITIEAFVPAQLTVSKLHDLCINSAPVSLVPLAPGSGGTWYGTGLQGAAFNPSLSGAGEFILSYHTASYPSGLCPDASTLAVKVFSLAAPRLEPAGPFCNSAAPVQLTVSPLGGLFEGNGLAVTPSGLFRPSSAMIGANIVSYSISNGPCIAYTQATINVEKFVSAALKKDDVILCRNNDAFNLNSLVINPGGFWKGAAVTNNFMFDPALAMSPGLNEVVYQTYSSNNPLLCPDSRTLYIKVEELPSVSVLSNNYQGCAPLEVKLNAPNVNAGKGEWNFGDGSKNGEGLVLTHTYRSPGTYSVTFNYSVGACYTRTTLTLPIKALAAPRADFEFSTPELSISDPQVTLINRSAPLEQNTYTWTIQGQGHKKEIHPQLTFPSAGTYHVELKAKTIEGCESSVTKFIEVKNDFDVFVPSAFSPNFDGLNDRFIPVFSPHGLDRKSFEMEVYDRWGHLVCKTTDISKGWDGTLNNKGDNILKEGVYVYKLRYKDLEGKAYQRTGQVTLLP